MGFRNASLVRNRRWICGVRFLLVESSHAYFFFFNPTGLFGGRWTFFVRLLGLINVMMINDLRNIMSVLSYVAV